MQPTKDTFYLALRGRLVALDPARTVIVDGQMRPAVLVAENEPVTCAPSLPNAFYLWWGAPQVVPGSEHESRPLMKMECRITYRAPGTLAGSVDRGRALAELDGELLRLLTPPRTPKLDGAQAPALALGTTIFWGMPQFDEAESQSGELRRTARLAVFFFSEVNQA